MANKSLAGITADRDQAVREIAEVERALQEGFPPSTVHGSHIFSATRIAADRLGMVPQSLRGRVGVPGRPGGYHRAYGLTVDWSKYKPRPAPERPVTAVDQPPRAPDDVSGDRQKRQDRDLANENKKLREALIEAQDIRGGIAGLLSDPPAPRPLILPKRGHSQAGEVPLLNLYDLQWGEVVDLAAMGGINSYNAEIAERRLARYFATCIDLLTEHWKGPPPPKVYLALGGDLVSGQLHDLPKTNDRSAPEAVRDLVALLKGGVEQLSAALLKKWGIVIPIEIVSVPGNHGRITILPDDKRYVVDSYDTLVAWMLEMHFNRPGSNVTVTIPPSGDALVPIYGRNILWSHGDRIGGKGGDGAAGVAAPIARGMRRVFSEYAELGIRLYKIIVGHMHTALELEDGFASGSLVGPSERGRRFRFKPLPATQWLLTVHPRYGIAQRWQVQVGDPSEGSIYEMPSEAVVEKQKRRAA